LSSLKILPTQQAAAPSLYLCIIGGAVRVAGPEIEVSPENNEKKI
jgi:hypothetical protein